MKIELVREKEREIEKGERERVWKKRERDCKKERTHFIRIFICVISRKNRKKPFLVILRA
jgi:hypothetical protein